MHIAIVFIGAGWPVRHRDGDHAPGTQDIVEVVPSVRADGHVRRVEVALQVRVVRILVLAVNHAFIPPVAQVAHGRGPADVVARAVHVPAEKIMGSVDIDPVPEDIRFSVRHIFPVGEIGIDHLFLIHGSSPPGIGFAEVHYRYHNIFRAKSKHQK